MDLTFFGLTHNTAPQARMNVFNTIHEIVFHGKGGYDWETIYNMPIWLRRFTWNKISEFYDTQAQANKPKDEIDISNPIKSNIPKEVLQRKSQPDYISRASKK